MAENLFCKEQKGTTDKFRKGFDSIKWNKPTEEKESDDETND